jgi:hypothetical protein
MKRGLATICMLLTATLAQAQIPNGNFETWQGDSVLVGWLSVNTYLARTTQRSTDAHSGSYALQGMVASFYGAPLVPLVQSGADGQGFGYTSRAATLDGWYKFSTPSGSGAYFFVTVLFEKNNSGFAAGSMHVNAPASSYTQFSVPIDYISGDIPDTAIIQFGIGDSISDDPHLASSTFLVDDFSFSGTNAVENQQSSEPMTYTLQQNYPNPFNPSTTISFSLAQSGPTTLIVYDLLGRKVATLIDGEMSAGTHSVRFDDTKLPSGVYIYQLASRTFRATKTMTLLK